MSAVIGFCIIPNLFLLHFQLPDKSIASLVKYYYSWKKTRSRTSVMDRQEKMKAKEGSENGSENGSNDDSDSEDKVCLSLRFPQISISTIIVHKC